MPLLVVCGAKLTCNCGTTPASLAVLPGRMTDDSGNEIATIDDFVPMTNIPAFGMCTTQANPQVAAATTAANGVLTPQPCVPVTTAPWSPGASVTTLLDRPVLTADSKASCAWSGSIEITSPGSQVNVE